MPSFVVVDDDPQVRLLLGSVLGEDGSVVHPAATAREGLDLVLRHQPDLVVVDLRLPDLDGVELVTRLRRSYAGPVLVVSAVTQERHRVRALDAGADDYLTKPFGIPELLARLRALLRRATTDLEPPDTRPLVFGSLHVDREQTTATLDGVPVRLTPTEWRLLAAFVSHPGKLLTHSWLLNEVWDSRYGDESRQSLRAHIRSLRAKIGDSVASPRFIATASGVGYRWLGDEEEIDAAAADAGRAALERDGDDDGDDDGGEDGREDGGPAGSTYGGGRDEVVHDLGNVLTALHLAVHVARRNLREEVALIAADRVDQLVDRASALVVDLERREPARVEPEAVIGS